jgi:hypothetical protein
MARLILLIGLAAALFIIFRWLSRQPPRVYWQVIAVLLAAVLLTLVVTGRAHWLTAVFAAMLPFVRGLMTLLGGIPLLKRVLAGMDAAKSRDAPSGGQTSTVQSKYIRMTLNHDSGDVNGEVLTGRFKGSKLDQLDFDALLQLLRECEDDEESVALLQTYLEREHADSWQQQAGTQGDAGETEIIEAHRRLMQKLHPDRGGSAYLAAKINLAKDTLLGG